MCDYEKQQAANVSSTVGIAPQECAGRELTPKELLGKEIERAELALRDLRALQAALPDEMAWPASRALSDLIRGRK